MNSAAHFALMNFALSIGSATDNRTTDTDFLTVVKAIVSEKWRGSVDAIRAAYARNDTKTGDSLKRALPAVLWSGTFSKRTADALIQHSGLVHVDLDKLGDQRESWRDLICADPHTLFCFTSPSGNGLKVVYRCDPERPHIESFRAAEAHVLEQFGLTADPACKDVNRLCFVSADPEAYVNEDAEPLEYPPERVEFKAPAERMPGHRLVAGATPGDDYDTRGDWQSVMRKHGWTCQGEHRWRRPGKESGLSATWNTIAGQPNRLYVFSSNAEPFEQGHVYRPWHIYALLECGGDFSRAARELGEQGYGEQRKKDDRAPEVYDPGYEEPVNGTHITPPPPESTKATWPEPIAAFALCVNPPKIPPALIDGLLYENGTMLVSGPSKAHKTFTALDLAVAISTGSQWLGFKTTSSAVLYLNLELQEFAAADRLMKICSARGVEWPTNLHLWNLRGHTVSLTELMGRLPEMIQRNSYKAVFIDPHYKVSAVSGMEENSNDSQGALLSTLEGLCCKNGAGLINTHHFAKGDASGKNAIDRASGGGVFARWGDVIMTLTPHEEDDAMTVEMALRNFAPVEPFAVRWEYPRWTRDGQLDPSKLKTSRGPKEKNTAADALRALGSNLLTYAEWEAATGMTTSTFKRKRQELLDEGLVEKSGQCYRRKSA